MELSLIVPFWNGHKHLPRLLDSLPSGLDLIIVDDKSDTPLEAVSRPNTRVVRLKDKGYFAGAINAALPLIESGDVLILNQDAWFENDDWLNLLEDKRGEYGLIGEGVARHKAWPRGYIHGTFMYIRRDVLEAVGNFNQRDYPLWGNTCEYQLRACRKGFRALPLKYGSVPGFKHARVERHQRVGDSIQELLRRRPNKRGLFIRTPPMISVVINCYNHGHYLPDTVNSLIGGPNPLGEWEQSFQGFEIVIVDDGSTDDTPAYCERLADDWKGIRCLRQDNKGSAGAMNTGIAAANGKFIAPLDADDMMKPERLERMLRVVERDERAVVYDDLTYFAYDHYGIKTKKHETQLTLTMPLPKEYDFERILWKNMMHKGLLFSKRAWEEVGGYPEVMNRGREDWAFNVALGINGYCGVHTGYAEYLYRREGQNRTLTNTSPEWRLKFQEQLIRLFPNVYAGERPMGCCGGSRKPPRVSRAVLSGVVAMQDLPGKNGMELLEYTGPSAGDQTWMNHKEGTGTQYVFGGVHRIGYVDKGDVKWLLDIRRSGKSLFRRVPKPKKVEVKKQPVPEIEEVLDVAEATVATEYPDLGDLTVAQLRVALSEHDYPDDVLQDALMTESRVTAQAALREALGV